jgi:hypothetical protein
MPCVLSLRHFNIHTGELRQEQEEDDNSHGVCPRGLLPGTSFGRRSADSEEVTDVILWRASNG